MSNKQKQEIMTTEIKIYCKKFGYKFERMISEKEFITSKKVSVFAGMEYVPGTNKIVNTSIREIGKKTLYEKHLCFDDGDIVGNGNIISI